LLSASTIANRMIQQLRLLDPAFSLEVGTPERKILDTVAEFVAGSQVDYSVLLRQHDLDTMTGGRLDAYLGNFGWGRQVPRAAVGRVTFSRTGATLDPLTIPRGTQLLGVVDNPAFPNLIFATTETVVMGADSTSVDAPVRCTTYGTIGNLPVNSITSFAGLRGISGITSVTNTQPTTGGFDGESDAEYKLRFRNSIFRNMSGTYDHIMALALSAPTVSKVNVVGPISRYAELIQIPVITDDGENEVQSFTIAADATTFTVTVKDEIGNTLATSASIAQGATGDDVQTAINAALDTALSTVSETHVVVTRSGSGPYTYTVTFRNRLGRRNLALMAYTITGGGSAGTANATGVTAGAAPTGHDDIQTTVGGSFGYDNHSGLATDAHNWPFKVTSPPSTIPNSKFTYPDGHFLTDSTLSAASAYFFRPGVDYFFNDVPITADAGEAYANAHAYAVGDLVKGTGATGSGRLFVCIEAGTSDTVSPTWDITEGYLSETMVGTGQAEAPTFALIGLTTGSAFQPSYNYALNDLVQHGDDLFIVTADAGSSGASMPTWDTSAVDATTVSGSITFTYLGQVTHSYISSAYPYQPNVTILVDQGTDGSPIWPSGIEGGDILLLEHQYMSQNSRNDYSLGISNCVEVFVNGGEETNVDSAEVISGQSHNLQDTDPSHWTYQKLDDPRVINFERGLDGRACSLGNRLTPLLWQPVLELPDSITIGQNKYLRANYYVDEGEAFRPTSAYAVGEVVQKASDTELFVCTTAGTSGGSEPVWDVAPIRATTTSGTAVFTYIGDTASGAYFNQRTGSGTEASPYLYTKLAHYAFARSVNGNAGSIRAKDGIEWLIAAPQGNAGLLGILTDINGVETYTGAVVTGEDNQGVQFDVQGYVFDQNIQFLQSLEDSHKQVGTDILVHRALRRYFKAYITVMYSIGANEAIVNASIDAALAVFYENQYYGAAIQLSDILQAIHDVPGVDNVRWTADRRYDTVPAWDSATAYSLGDIVRPSTTQNGFVFEAIRAGTSNATEPIWPDADGDTIVDSGVTWRALTEVRVEEVNPQGEALESGSVYFTTDFFIEDRELAAAPLLNVSVVVKRAQHTWDR